MEVPNDPDRPDIQRGISVLSDAENGCPGVPVVAFEGIMLALQADPLPAVAEEFIVQLAKQGYDVTTRVNLSRTPVRIGAWVSS